MNKSRYIVIEIPEEATAAEFEVVAGLVLEDVERISTALGDVDYDLFAFVPHSHQETKLQELFGPYTQEPEPRGD